MIIIAAQPSLVNLSGLPVIFRVSSNMFDEPYFRIKAVPVAGQAEYLKLNLSDEAIFDLREFFAAELKSELKTGPSVHPDAAKEFEPTFYEYYGVPPTTHASATETIVVVRGSIPRWYLSQFYQNYDDFNDFIAAEKHLTLWPRTQAKRVLPGQPELIYFLAPSSGTYSPSVLISYADGTTASHSPAISVSAQALQVASLPVGYTALGIAGVSPSKTVSSYTVTIAGVSRTYTVDHTPYREVRYLIFRNSLGGYDTFACTGEADESTRASRQVAEAVYDPDHLVRANKRVYAIVHNEVVKVNSGWLLPTERDWLNELLISDEVFEQIGNVIRPVMMINTELDRSRRRFNPGSVEIEYERLSIVV